MKKILTLLSILGLSLMVSAQTISKSELAEIQGSFVKDASTIALQNILTNDKNIKTKALNHAKVTNPVDHYFKYRVDIKGITDQKSSGRCWMFTSMNVFRPDVINQLNVLRFDFSHNSAISGICLRNRIFSSKMSLPLQIEICRIEMWNFSSNLPLATEESGISSQYRRKVWGSAQTGDARDRAFQ